MSNRIRTLLGAAGLAGLCTAALGTLPAQAKIEGLSGNAAFTTDYVWRGKSQSAGEAAMQGGLNYDAGNGFSAGTWLSSINFGDNSPVEWDVFGAYAGNITSQLSYTAGVIGYLYPESPAAADYNFVELHGGLGYNLGFATLTGEIYYSPDITGPSTESSEYYTFGASVPVLDWLSANLHYGVYDFSGPSPDYNDWSLGLTATYDAYSLALAYIGTDDSAPDRYVATFSFAL